MIQSDKNTFS